MLCGSFGIVHIISLVLVALINICLYFILKNKSDIIKKTVLFILSLSGLAAIVFNLIAWGSPLEYLPFHLCSLTALVLPFAVLTKNNVLSNLLLLWSLGALAALVMNQAQANFEILSATFFFYYFPHAFEFGIPILLFALKLTKKDIKYIGSTLGITIAAYTAIHFINLAVNAYCLDANLLDKAGEIIQVNYMYSITPSIPVLQAFWNIIPAPYWYLLLATPIILIYLAIVYTPEFIKALRKRKHNL